MTDETPTNEADAGAETQADPETEIQIPEGPFVGPLQDYDENGVSTFKAANGSIVELSLEEIESEGLEVYTAQAPDPVESDEGALDSDGTTAADAGEPGPAPERASPGELGQFEYECANHRGNWMTVNLDAADRWDCGQPGKCAAISNSGRPVGSES